MTQELARVKTIQVVNKDGSTGTATIPADSVPIPPDGLMPGTQAASISRILQIFADGDMRDMATFQAACQAYLTNAGRDRDLGMSPDKWPTKPLQPVKHTVAVLLDTTGVAWLVVNLSLNGDPCPDLPPATPAAPPVGIQIGNHNWGLYWAQGPQDNPPQDVQQGRLVLGETSLDGVSGNWQFVPHPFSNPIYGAKGWYLKVA